MDKRDLILDNLIQEQQKAEDLEEAYRHAKRELEEEGFRLDHFSRGIRERLESKIDGVQSHLRAVTNVEAGDYFSIANNVFQTYLETNDQVYRLQLAQLEDKADELNQNYKKQSILQEERIENIYHKLKQLEQE